MKKTILSVVTLAVMTAFTTQAKADVFSDYQTLGTETLELARNPDVKTDEFITKIKGLARLGYQIMDLYVVKYPECKEQFAQLKSVDAQILTLSYEEIDELYHDGTGLVAAPRACYKGRSLVVHPYQVAALALEEKLDSEAGVVEHELNEVIERAEKIKADLGL